MQHAQDKVPEHHERRTEGKQYSKYLHLRSIALSLEELQCEVTGGADPPLPVSRELFFKQCVQSSRFPDVVQTVDDSTVWGG